MIKTISNLIIFLTLFQSCKGQSDNAVLHKPNLIDSIKTANQLSNLISKIDYRYKDFKINEDLKFENRYSGKNYKKIADSLKVQPWTKADFDNNGLTDILIIGTWTDHHVICILDKGNTHYEIKSITRQSFQDCTFPIVKNDKIIYYFESNPDRENWSKPRKLESIILTYQYGDFIEENQKPATHKIEKIDYSTSGCFGTCPIFNLKINSDRTSEWFADMYNEIDKKELKGSFQTTIAQDKFDELINLLNYIDFTELKDNYAVSWTDDQSSTLKITYDNGKIKSINDYGLIGTYGLDRVYQQLFKLRENQKWTK
jgi:Domain of unknown function (DUF6438)